MQKTPHLSVTPSSATTSISGSAKRRSTRIPRRSEEAVGFSDIRNAMGDKALTENVDQTNSSDTSPAPQEGWKHPAELQYIRRADWSQDLMITYLCQKAFTVPPRQPNTTLSYIEITRSFSGEKIQIPRGYRIPLMFVAKFQWESLRLVLNSASEWEEYKFDIIHLSRLCTHFFKQAKAAASEDKLTKAWRSPMFDRALIRFYRKWMVSREWSVKKFWEEFEEDEYKLDVLKFDWSRWVLKGHKGFVLAKEEVQNGITADQYRNGLKRKPDGTWVWGGDDSGVNASSLDVLNSLASQDAVEAITDAIPSHDSIEVKQELLDVDDETEVLNPNGKRKRAEDGDSPRKIPTRVPKKSRARHKISARKKAAANASTLVGGISPPSSAGDERPENLEGKQQEEDIAMDKYPGPHTFSLTNTLKIIPLSHGRKRRVLLSNKSRKSGKSSPTRAPTMMATPIDIPTDQQLALPLIFTPTSTGDPAFVQASESSTIKDLFPTHIEEVSSAVHPSTGENGNEGIFHKSPLLSDAQMRHKIPDLKTIPIPRPSSRPSDTPTSAQSETASLSLAPGNSDVSADGHESNPTSTMTSFGPSGPSMQSGSADPEIVPNAEASDLSTAATMNDLIVDAPLLSQSNILPSLPTADPSASTNSIITTPSSSLPTSEPAIVITPNPHSSSDSSFSCPPNIHEGVHVSVLPPNLPDYCADISHDSNGTDNFNSGDGDPTSLNPPPFLPKLKFSLIQSILDTVQRMAAVPQIKEPQTTIETVIAEGSRFIKAREERNMAEDSIVIPLSPVLSQSEQLIHPANLTSGTGEVETIIVGTQSIVEEVNMEENGTVGEVTNDEVPTTAVQPDSGSEAVVYEAKEKDMVGKLEVVDTMDGLVDDTDGVNVRRDKRAVEVQLVQSRRETPTMDEMDGVDVAMEKDAVEIRPVHNQSRQETPMNDTDGAGIALEVGAVESQLFDSRPFLGTPADDSRAGHHSAIESVPSRTELHGGDSQEFEITLADDSEDKMNVDEETIQPTPPLPTDESSTINRISMTPAVQTESLHSIQLLQDLIRFLQMQDGQPSLSRRLEDDMANHRSQGTCPAVERPCYPLTEEAVSVDQRLDVLAHVSATLVKNLVPYRGKELETKIDLLQKSLHQQFEMIQQPPNSPFCREIYELGKELDALCDVESDRNTASTSTRTISQGVQTLLPSHVNQRFESIEVQTDSEHEVLASQQPLSADATMVDFTIPTTPLQEAPSTPATKGEPLPDNNHSVAKTVMSMMRNMADLLECTTQGSIQGTMRSVKGKEKEVIDVDMMPSYIHSPTLTTILEEFKSMKEEMRRSQHRSQSVVESMRLSHFMEVEALKDEIRNIEDKGKRELDEVTRRYSEQIGELKTTIRLKEERERARDREKESGSETKVSSLDLLEIRRRVASLEARSRSDSISADMLRSASRSSMTNGHFSEPVIARHSNFNPPHLIPTDFEEQSYTTTLRAPRQYMTDGSMSKPGTPAPSDRNPFSSRHPDVMDLDESMPLPAKSQRKMHMMNFSRLPMG